MLLLSLCCYVVHVYITWVVVSRDVAVVRELTSHQCVPGSILTWCHVLLVLALLTVLFSGFCTFSPSTKIHTPIRPGWRTRTKMFLCTFCEIIFSTWSLHLKFATLASFRYKKTIPQLLIRWSVQKNYITIPKSSKQERILENADIFDFAISEEDMKILVSLHLQWFWSQTNKRK